MLGRLTDYFSQVDEPVILVFWGDHYNPIDSNYDVFTKSGYASDSSADPASTRRPCSCGRTIRSSLWTLAPSPPTTFRRS